MSKTSLKILTVSSVLGVVAFIFCGSQFFNSRAEGDDVFQSVAKYKTWAKISKAPIKAKLPAIAPNATFKSKKQIGFSAVI
ncbi:MAG TPA: hypothetical protein VGO50_04375 [Pyrinomonadaceae bacterium]|jgi:hypothetical protein|nr:hypothetical protein [Pyrinomonadaceae bacterium]